jgi:hypothetical protein
MGCTPGTTPEYLLLLQMHKMQKPSVSQGLYPILPLALSALMTSAYTSLGVPQDSNPRCQLLKATVYYSATSATSSAVPCMKWEGATRVLTCDEYAIDWFSSCVVPNFAKKSLSGINPMGL